MPPEVVIPADITFTDWCIQISNDGLFVDGASKGLQGAIDGPACLPSFAPTRKSLDVKGSKVQS